MNVWDILIIALIAVAVVTAVYFMRKDKKKCGKGCSCCAYYSACKNSESKDKE